MKHLIFKIIVIAWKFSPFKNMLSKVIKINSYLLAKTYKDLRFKGVMNLTVKDKHFKLYNPGFTTIENEIYWKGFSNGWEKKSLELWQMLVVESDCILDIGANTGIYSFVATTLNPNAKIYSFEPVKRTSMIFKENLKLNPKNNICFIEKAVSNKKGRATFYDIESTYQYSASLNSEMLDHLKNKTSYEVDIVSLDLLDEIQDQKIDLIKLDVEMHEPEAIEGMITMLKKNKPTIFVEILNNSLGERIEELVSSLGYCYFMIDEVNEPIRIPHLKKSGLYNYLLCSEQTAKKLSLNCEL